MAHSRWRQLLNICIMWAHDVHVIFCQQDCICPIQPIMYLTIYTSGPIGGSLCYCQLTCNGPQQVATAAKHMSHMGPYDGCMCILPISLYWPMMAMHICCRQACIGPIQPIMDLKIFTSVPIGGSLCYCQLACNGQQQVVWLPNICLVWANDGHMCILPNSLHWPMMAICIFYRQACIGPIQPIVYATIYMSGPIGGACVTADDIMMAKSR